MDTNEAAWRAKVFRLRGIPNAIATPTEVASLVASTFGDISAADVIVGSLATCLEWENPPSRIATLQFQVVSARLRSEGGSRVEWEISGSPPLDRLTLDCHFLGLTPLNDVPASILHTVEYEIPRDPS